MLLLLLPLLAMLRLGVAQELPSVMNGSVFVYEGQEQDFGPPRHHRSSDPKITFALNADSSTGDLYFHLESPKDNQWVGVGIGSAMVNSLFLIAYASANGSGVTISVRTADRRSEPSAVRDLTVDKIYDSGLVDANTVTGGGKGDDEEGNIVVDAVCRRCADYEGLVGIDYQNTEQPFIFAIGPPSNLESDSVDAGIQQHILHGSFLMDMSVATSADSASVPQPPYTMSSSTTLQLTRQDNDPGSRIHGIVMCVVFVIILPIGALVLRVWNVKAHIAFQLIGWMLFCAAFAGGVVASGKYNKSKNFASGHQVLGILLLIALFSQWVLGWMNHRTYKKQGQGTVLGKVHLYLGPVIIFLGWINGGLGFRFANNSFVTIPYTVLIIVMIIVYALVRTLITRRRNRQAKAGQAPPGMPAFGSGGYGQGGYGGQGQSAPLAQQQEGYHRSAPDDDAPPPAYSGQGIHLQQYPSAQSLPQPGQAAVQPRTMV